MDMLNIIRRQKYEMTPVILALALLLFVGTRASSFNDMYVPRWMCIHIGMYTPSYHVGNMLEHLITGGVLPSSSLVRNVLLLR